MATMGFMHVDEALRLANERLAGFQREARHERSRPVRSSQRRGGGLRRALARAGAAFREVEVTPLPRLLGYSYRP